MTKAEEYRGYAAECMALAQRRQNAEDKAGLVRMAEMWLRMAEVAEKRQGTDDSSTD